MRGILGLGPFGPVASWVIVAGAAIGGVACAIALAAVVMAGRADERAAEMFHREHEALERLHKREHVHVEARALTAAEIAEIRRRCGVVADLPIPPREEEHDAER